MSATLIRLEWGVTVEDAEHWTEAQREACALDDPTTYEDWVLPPLQRAMEAAGNAYIAAHPDLFRGDLI